MSNATKGRPGSGESATVAVTRAMGQPGAVPADAPEWAGGGGQAPAEVAEVITGTAVDEAVARTAAFVESRRYGPNTVDLVMFIAANALDTADLNQVIIEQMATKFAEATSPDDILDPFGTIKGNTMLDRPLWVIDCQFLESDMADGFPYYASLMVQDTESGRNTVVTVGGEKLVMQAAAMTRAGGWPQWVKIHQSDKPTKAGYYPLELRRGQ